MKVSVLMPVYNGADVLGVAVNSILTQTLIDFELLIVNDGSTDGTLKVIRTFNDPRIRVIDLATNQGLTNALNIGLIEARGEYLARMDHDDIAHPARLEKQIKAMTTSGSVICGSAIQPFGAIKGPAVAYPSTDTDIRASLPVVSPFAHPTVVMLKEVAVKLGYCSTAEHCEDYDLWWRISKEGVMMNLPEALVRYRYHSKQISFKYRINQLSGMANIAVNQLKKDGRFRQQQDLDTHYRSLSYQTLESIDQLDAIGGWLHWLKSSFQIKSNDIDKNYNRVWRGVCSRQAHLGTKIWIIYKKHLHIESDLKSNFMVFLTAYSKLNQDSNKFNLIRKIIGR